MKYYYYEKDNKKLGPFTLEEIKSKRINNSTLVWTEGMKDWNRADTIDELKSILITEPPPLPSKNKGINKKHKIQIGDKYDLSYAREVNATLVGSLILIIQIILTYSSGEFSYRSFIKDRETWHITLLFLFVFRIILTYWVVNIANRQNRNTIIWGIFTFFLPSIALIIIGLQKKLLFNIKLNTSLPKQEQISFLMSKVYKLHKKGKHAESIKILDNIIEIDNKCYDAIKYRAISYYKIKEYEKAKKDYEFLNSENKFLSITNYYLGDIEIINHNREKAIKLWLSAKKEGNKSVEKQLNRYYYLAGKYFLNNSDSIKKIGNDQFSNFNMYDNIIKYISGISSIDKNEDINKIFTHIVNYENGIKINIFSEKKTYNLSIAYYEINDIVINEKQNKLKLILMNNISLLFDYKFEEGIEDLKYFLKKYNEKTGKSAKEISE